MVMPRCHGNVILLYTGGAIGVVFSLANAVAIALYVVGFAETVADMFVVRLHSNSDRPLGVDSL